MWAGLERQRERIRQAGLELAPGELLAAATGGGARLEGITVVLLLTGEDDFNALASTVLGDLVEDRVYRLGPPADSHGVVAPYTGAEILFGDALTRRELSRRYRRGASIVLRRADSPVPDGHDLLFLVRADGRLDAVTLTGTPTAHPGDIQVLLGPAPPDQAARRDGRTAAAGTVDLASDLPSSP
jgi:hypothetical protein